MVLKFNLFSGGQCSKITFHEPTCSITKTYDGKREKLINV